MSSICYFQWLRLICCRPTLFPGTNSTIERVSVFHRTPICPSLVWSHGTLMVSKREPISYYKKNHKDISQRQRKCSYGQVKPNILTREKPLSVPNFRIIFFCPSFHHYGHCFVHRDAEEIAMENIANLN